MMSECVNADVCLQVYGVFFATSFLDLYRSPHSVNTTGNSLIVTVDSDEQYLFLVSLVILLEPPPHYSGTSTQPSRTS